MLKMELKTPVLKEESNGFAFRFRAISEAAEARLRRSPYMELRNISCDFHEGVLTLRGRMPSYHLKQLAQALLSELEGVMELNNQLNVVVPADVGRNNSGPNNFTSRASPYL